MVVRMTDYSWFSSVIGRLYPLLINSMAALYLENLKEGNNSKSKAKEMHPTGGVEMKRLYQIGLSFFFETS
jgi:hypothetical protein